MLKSKNFWLVLSLCLNFLLIGAFVGGAMKFKRGGQMSSAPPNEVTAIYRTLPDDRREEVRGGFSQRQGKLERPNIDELANLIDAEPFEPEAVRGYFNANRERNDERVVAAQDTLLNTLDKMSDAERDAMAQDLRELPKRGHTNGRGDHKGSKDHKRDKPNDYD